jgi:hypothetical protein
MSMEKRRMMMMRRRKRRKMEDVEQFLRRVACLYWCVYWAMTEVDEKKRYDRLATRRKK